MRDRGPYRIDDILIQLGSVLAFFGILAGVVYAVIPPTARRMFAAEIGPWALAAIPLAVAPVGLWLAGWHVRRREQRLMRLLKILRTHLDVSLSDLTRNSGYTPDELAELVREINDHGLGYYVMDRAAGVIQDARLRHEGEVHDVCGACGAKVHVKVRTVGDLVECPYCDTSLGEGDAADDKQQLLDRLRQEDREQRERHEARGLAATGHRGFAQTGRGGFSPVMLVVLLVVFWPLGVAYAIKHARHMH